MKNWKKDIFNNFIKLNRGFDLPEKDIVDGIYPVVASTSIKAYHNKYKVNPPVVVTGRSGSLGTVQYINEKCWPLNTSLYVKDYKGNLPKYVFYFLKTLKLENFNAGAGVPSLNQNHLHKVPINIPKIEIQKKIASILSAYDDLIENNNKRIAILEKMAEELYREWFVRLRFPEHEKTKIVKGIPEGWEVKHLNEIASVIDCLHTKKPEEAEYGEDWLLQLENIKENGRFFKSYKYLISKSDYDRWSKNIEVKEGDCLVTNVGRIAAVAQIPRNVSAALGRNMTAIRAKKIPASFLIQYLLSPHMRNEVIKKQDLGAIMGALNVRSINKLEVLIPTIDIQEKFDETVSKIRNKLWILSEKNENLKTSRDKLLSRLMSGKIDVENLDIHFPPSMKEG